MAQQQGHGEQPEGAAALSVWRRRWLWRMSRVVASLFGVLLLLAIFHRFWLPLIGGFLIVADPLQPADAIVPLAGKAERVEYAATLYNEGYATWFVATSMPHYVPGIREPYSTLVSREAMWAGVPEDVIIEATTVVSTTYQEARVVRNLAQQQGWHSLLVVSSPSHTRRARWIFRDVFADTPIKILVHPVEDHWYTPDTWWQHPDGLRATWTEYLKFAMHISGYRV